MSTNTSSLTGPYRTLELYSMVYWCFPFALKKRCVCVWSWSGLYVSYLSALEWVSEALMWRPKHQGRHPCLLPISCWARQNPYSSVSRCHPPLPLPPLPLHCNWNIVLPRHSPALPYFPFQKIPAPISHSLGKEKTPFSSLDKCPITIFCIFSSIPSTSHPKHSQLPLPSMHSYNKC